MLFEIFDGGNDDRFLDFENADSADAAVLALANRGRGGKDEQERFKTLAEALDSPEFPHPHARAVPAYSRMPDLQPACPEYSKAFELLCALDEPKATAARLRLAAMGSTGLECEANIRLAEAAEVEVAHIEAALRGEARQEQEKGASASKGKRTDDVQVEIDDLMADMVRRGERATPKKVMAALSARAGSARSCVTEAFSGGVLWERGNSGTPERLTLPTLKSRIHRRKVR